MEFADRLGHKFHRTEILMRALTHGSASSPDRSDNQRLEFLGDRVLGLVIAEALLAADPEATEGQIAPRFNRLVRRETCAEIARMIDLGSALRIGRSEMKTGGRKKEAVLADAMEAVLAAVYLDAGFEAAKKVVLLHWTASIHSVDDDARDAKTALQEWAQGRGQTPPSYAEEARSGPDHAPVFTVRVTLQSGPSATGEAGSKRLAEHAAAAALLTKVTQND
ncbi:ribonuclease III [Ketogulonicigenium robustum]|uniref:Ribonuclease 3 n=1 Tax=Ketogulonicigenium robustum TaxID=92947 RepID=A0A1W6NX49_9RHOB|nr:ribonuclease III [Ketogulonicigenium robustum]ARO13769.1 ribonuclease III [Ketogulonicigenium robustum]